MPGKKGAKQHHYTEEHLQFIRDNVKGRPYQDLLNMFNAEFGAEISLSALRGVCKRFHMMSGLSGRYPKGNVPYLAGRKGFQVGGRSNETQFKSGHVPHNCVPIGTERISSDGYPIIKICDKGEQRQRWKPKSAIVWESVHGPIPKGCVIIVVDGNKLNTEINNLVMVSRKELAIMNNHGLIGGGRECTEAGKTIAKIILATSQNGIKQRQSLKKGKAP